MIWGRTVPLMCSQAAADKPDSDSRSPRDGRRRLSQLLPEALAAAPVKLSTPSSIIYDNNWQSVFIALKYFEASLAFMIQTGAALCAKAWRG